MTDYDDFDDPGLLVMILAFLVLLFTFPVWATYLGYMKAKELYDERHKA